MINITLTQPLEDYTEFSTTLNLEIPDETTVTSAVEAFVIALRAATYVDSSIYHALLEAAYELEEGVTVSHTSIKEPND